MQSLDQCRHQLLTRYDVVDEISCDYASIQDAYLDLYVRLSRIHQARFQQDQRLIVYLEQDFYHPDSTCGLMLQTLQLAIQDIDISNFFVCVVSTNPDLLDEYQYVSANLSWDPQPFDLYVCEGAWHKLHTLDKIPTRKFSSLKDIVPVISRLSQSHKTQLFKNDAFCLMPWISVMISPGGKARPCCEYARDQPIGNIYQNSLQEIWNSASAKALRQQMLRGENPSGCAGCHRREALGLPSLRQSTNKEFAQHVTIIDQTADDGTVTEAKIRYLDIRYNNLCNFQCRMCNPWSSSSWYEVHKTINPQQAPITPLLTAGPDEELLWQQVIADIDHIEKIYFAGGEPMMISKFYDMLELLDQRGRHDVHLVYNTNLSRLSLGQRSVLELWQRFPRVTVIASIDAEGQRAEYIRSGSDWPTIEQNWLAIKAACPHVNLMVSATVGLINALHVPDFHWQWVRKGMMQLEDFNVQLLLDPAYLSVGNAPPKLKHAIIERFSKHVQSLQSQDQLGRASAGFSSIIELCRSPDRYDAERFWSYTQKLDSYHGTSLFETFPELRDTGL